MPLNDLEIVAQTAIDAYATYKPVEVILSPEFKEAVSDYFTANLTDRIEFLTHSATINSPQGKIISLPNQWFIIASYFADLTAELARYKGHFETIFAGRNTETIAKDAKRLGRLSAADDALIKANLPDADDAEKLIKWITDYGWWSGNKTVDRGDYFNSPVLKLAKVIAESSEYIAKLAYMFGRDNRVLTTLRAGVTEVTPGQNAALSDEVLRTFIEKALRFLKGNNELEEFTRHKQENGDPKFFSVVYDSKTLTSVFWRFDHEASEAELTQAGKLRAFTEDLFREDGDYFYLSGEWSDNGAGRLDFQTFQNIFNTIFKGRYEVRHTGTRYELIIVNNQPLNQILFGPPGTGKTYNAINHALAVVKGCDVSSLIEQQRADPSARARHKAEFDQLVKDGRIQLVTFHQSFSYEEFVEGIRSKVNDKGQVYYKVEPGIFKRLCALAAADAKPYVLIIDEINRGSISKIFGELITLLEDSKRAGAGEELSVSLVYSGDSQTSSASSGTSLGGAGGTTASKISQLFTVPKNLYVIGTMNSTDKSISLVDTALRRRFTFIEYTADPTYLSTDVEGIDLNRLLSKINLRIEYLLDRDHLIGHAYFMGIETKAQLAAVLRNKIIPLLHEYFYNDFQKIQFVLGDNDEWKARAELRILNKKRTVEQRDVFGRELDFLDEKEIYFLNKPLEDSRFDEIPVEVFTGIYERPGASQPIVAPAGGAYAAAGDADGGAVEEGDDVEPIADEHDEEPQP